MQQGTKKAIGNKVDEFAQILTNTGKWSHGHKPRPDSLALALQDSRPGQSPQEASILAWLSLAHGLRPGHAHHYMPDLK